MADKAVQESQGHYHLDDGLWAICIITSLSICCSIYSHTPDMLRYTLVTPNDG
jgi:hypothetical protein